MPECFSFFESVAGKRRLIESNVKPLNYIISFRAGVGQKALF